MSSSQSVSSNANSSETSIRNTTPINVVTAILCLILAGLFLANQPQLSDFGQSCQAFFTTLTAGKIFSAQVIGNNVLATLIVLLVGVSWGGLGGVILRLIAPNMVTNFAARISWQLGIGSTCWSLIWFFLGLVHGYKKHIAVVFLLIGVGVAGYELAHIFKSFTAEKLQRVALSGQEKFFVSVLCIPILLGFIAALAPVTGKDALVYRLAVPQAYLAAQGIIDVPNNVYSYLSFGAEMHSVWAMLVSQFFNAQVAETAFSLIGILFYLCLSLVVYGVAREWKLQRKWALLATFLVASVPSIYQVASTGYVDHTLAFYLLLAAFAAGQWWRNTDPQSVLLMACALGGALAVKFLALFGFIAISILVLLKLRAVQRQGSSEIRKILLSGCTALIGGGLLASPWYLRLWVRTGSPLVPFYAHLWNGKMIGWDAERSHLFQLWVSQYGGAEKNLLDYLFAFVKISLFAKLEDATLFDGVIGISGLVGLPLLIWGIRQKRVPVSALVAASIAGIWFLLWLLTSQQLRFLLPALPLLILGIITSAAQISPAKSSLLEWVFCACSLLGLLVIFAWFFEQNPLSVSLGGEARTAYLARRLEFYSYYETINQTLPANAKIWLINMRNDTVHLQREFIADYIFEDYTLTELVRGANNLQELRAKVKSLGITHIMMRHDVLLDYQRTPIVDERKSEAENQAKLLLLKEFLEQGTTVIKRDEKYLLLKL